MLYHCRSRANIPVLLFTLCQLTNFILIGRSIAGETNKFYSPNTINKNQEIIGTLSDQDIPLGDGIFVKDYRIQLKACDAILISLTSDNFDPIVSLLAADGKTLGKNDDSPDGTSNSLLFTQIKTSGTYTVRVQGFSDTSGGEFKLKLSQLCIVDDNFICQNKPPQNCSQ